MLITGPTPEQSEVEIAAWRKHFGQDVDGVEELCDDPESMDITGWRVTWKDGSSAHLTPQRMNTLIRSGQMIFAVPVDYKWS